MAEVLAAPVLSGRRINCTPFTVNDISESYLAWLNDPEVNRYSRRRYMTTTRPQAEHFLAQLPPNEYVLAIRLRTDGKHIGNIQLGSIDTHSSHAEIRILMGDKTVWGQGYATEAIYLATRYLFEKRQMHRVEANTCNPAFARCVEKLGWVTEGRLRERFLCDGQRLDYLWISILARDFKKRPEFEPA